MTPWLRLPSGFACAAALLACGARTQLDVPGGSQPVADGGPTSGDGGPTNPVDSSIPPAEAGTPCDDGGHPELSYVLDDVGTIYRYDVLTGKVTALGTPNCADDNVQWTMTASRTTAYILYTDWTLYAVDLSTLVCTQTPYQTGQLGFDFDYGIAVSSASGTEKLYVYGLPTGATNPILAVSDLTSFVLTEVGDILPAPPPSTYPVNLTADTQGHLYAFSPLGWVQQIDAATGAVLQSKQTDVTTMTTWATLTRGSDLYLWVESEVVGYDLATGAHTSQFDAGVAAVGGNSVLLCATP
jgi:hypothetical protein